MIGILLMMLISSLSFGALAPAASLSYDEAIATILERSTSVASEGARLDSIQSQNLSSRLALMPTVSAYAQKEESADGAVRAQTAGAEAKLNLFRFGADVSAMRAAHWESEAQGHRVDQTILDVEDRAVITINNYLTESLQNKVLSDIVAMRVASLETAEQRFQRGYLAKQEVLKVSVDLENDRAKLQESSLQLARAEGSLIELLGHSSINQEWPWKERIQSVLSNVSTLSESALRDRPDWKSQEASVSGHEARAFQKLGHALPSLDVSLRYGLTESLAASSTLPRGERWTGALTLTVPLFDRLENIGGYAAERALARASDQQLEAVRRKARAEFAAEKQALKLALDTALLRDKNRSVARNLYRDNLRRFQGGLVDANALSIDQERLYRSELLAIEGWALAHTSLMKLCHAHGKRIQKCLAENK